MGWLTGTRTRQRPVADGQKGWMGEGWPSATRWRGRVTTPALSRRSPKERSREIGPKLKTQNLKLKTDVMVGGIPNS